MATEAPWKSWKGSKRIQAEYKALSKALKDGHLGPVKEVDLLGDDLFKW